MPLNENGLLNKPTYKPMLIKPIDTKAHIMIICDTCMNQISKKFRQSI